jgi:hypothetical protein
MSDFDWTFEVVENSSEKISIRGYNNFPTFPWNIDLNIEKYKPLKISHKVTNNTGYDALNSQLFYIIDANQSNAPFIYYEKRDGNLHTYDYSTNKHFTRADTNFEQYYDRVSLGNFGFNYNDIIEDNFGITRAFFGNLDDLDAKLPDTNGFALGFSKGGQIIENEQSIEIDPTINTASDTGDGYLEMENGAPFSTPTRNSIVVGHEGDGANYDWHRAFMKFTLPYNRKVKEATLYLTVKENFSSGESCDFDLNLVQLKGTFFNWDDWYSTVYEKTINNWFDETVTGTIDGNIATAWNAAVSANRSRLDFKIGIDDENSYTDTTNDCRITFDDTGESNPPYIEYELETDLDVNISAPIGGYYLSTSKYSDSNYPIDFNIINIEGDTNYLFADIFYSTTRFGQETVIVEDLNLYDIMLNPTADANCSSNSGGFSSASNCFYDLKFLGISDGNYFIDINSWKNEVNGVFNFDSNWFVKSGATSFYLDNTNPSTSWDGNHNTWQTNDANINLTCVDAETCDTTFYRFDQDSGLFIDWTEWLTGTDINLPSPGNIDGNWAVRFYSTDVAGNTGDTNTFYVLIDRTAPTISTFTPDANTTTSDTTPDLNAYFTDAHSGIVSCGYKINVDEAFHKYGTTTAVGGNCQYTHDTDLADGQSVHADWNATDAVGNTSDYSKGFSQTYSAPVVAPPTGGPGGGGGGAKFYNFVVSEPENKAVSILGTIGSVHPFTIRVKNEAAQANAIIVTVDENLSHIIECGDTLILQQDEAGEIACTATLDVNAAGLQTALEGDITLRSQTKVETIKVKVLAFELVGIGGLSAMIKENAVAFGVAVLGLLGAITLVFLGISKYFKGWPQAASILGGGSLAALLALAIII